MSEEPTKIVVIGDGGWGTALALVLCENGHRVTLWSAFPEQAARLESSRQNDRFLPGVGLPAALAVTGDDAALAGAELAVSAVPTRYLRAVLERLAPAVPAGLPLVSVSKGLEPETLLFPSGVIEAVLGRRPLAALSGPSHAEEAARGRPTTVVAAAPDRELAALVQRLFSRPTFRVYTHDDLVGVELGGALKHAVASAAGIGDGLGLGDNAKAALVARGLAEISRLGEALGASPATFAGLSGLGDLVVSCFSRHGRNRAVGEGVGRGLALEEVLAGIEGVPEGVSTVPAVLRLAAKVSVEMPITAEVERVLFAGKDPATAVNDLMTRELRPEAN